MIARSIPINMYRVSCNLLFFPLVCFSVLSVLYSLARTTAGEVYVLVACHGVTTDVATVISRWKINLRC